MLMLGGAGTILGPALGAFLYEELRGLLLTTQSFSHFQLVIAGALLLAIVLFVPGGLLGWLHGLFREHGSGLNERAARGHRGEQALRRAAGRAGPQPSPSRGRNPRSDRAERRRQVDRVQPDQRRLRARHGAASSLPATTSPAGRRTASPGVASPARIRSCSRSRTHERARQLHRRRLLRPREPAAGAGARDRLRDGEDGRARRPRRTAGKLADDGRQEAA